MVVRRRFVWLLVLALALLVAPDAGAKWVWEIPNSESAGPFIGPDDDEPKGGIDPDEPLGPERLAAHDVELAPTGGETSSVWHAMRVLVRLDWVGWLIR